MNAGTCSGSGDENDLPEVEALHDRSVNFRRRRRERPVEVDDPKAERGPREPYTSQLRRPRIQSPVSDMHSPEKNSR